MNKTPRSNNSNSNTNDTSGDDTLKSLPPPEYKQSSSAIFGTSGAGSTSGFSSEPEVNEQCKLDDDDEVEFLRMYYASKSELNTNHDENTKDYDKIIVSLNGEIENLKQENHLVKLTVNIYENDFIISL